MANVGRARAASAPGGGLRAREVPISLGFPRLVILNEGSYVAWAEGRLEKFDTFGQAYDALIGGISSGDGRRA